MVSGLKLFDLNGKTALITGSSQGIGYALAKGLADAGSDIILNGRNTEKLKQSAEAINTKQNIFQLCFDATNYEQTKRSIDKFEKDIKPIDILINNAGIALPTSIDNDDFEVYWDKTHNVLLKGQAVLIRECLPFIEKSNTPRIVNISSTEGLGASPMHSPYTSAKHGVIGLTRSLAVELGKKGITVNCICPGPINTAMTEKIPDKDKEVYSKRRVPLRRYGDPEEVAHATLNFCLPSSSFITGAVLAVDGGLTIKRA